VVGLNSEFDGPDAGFPASRSAFLEKSCEASSSYTVGDSKVRGQGTQSGVLLNLDVGDA